jgi:hypothetical protein
MTTQAQRDANRRNAQKSTGPKTPEGKAKSSRNALWHGVTAETLVLPDETAEAFEELYLDLVRAYGPADAAEEALVERIALGQWRLRRVWRAEAAAFREDCDSIWPDRMDKLARYEAMLERHLHRALVDLDRAQHLRRVRIEEAQTIWRERLHQEELARDLERKHEAAERSQMDLAATHPFPELVALTSFAPDELAKRSQSNGEAPVSPSPHGVGRGRGPGAERRGG